MAISGDIVLGAPRIDWMPVSFHWESVSFTTSAGTQSSNRAVPAGKMWNVQSVFGHNPDSVNREIEVIGLDADGTDHVRLSQGADSHASVVGGGNMGWHGALWLPAGWKIGCRWFAMASGLSCVWRFTALEYQVYP